MGPAMTASASLDRANRRLAARLLVVTAAMFGFGYALVPLYDIVCDITGFNGRTGVLTEEEAAAASGAAAAGPSSRAVKVQFVATVHSGLRWVLDPPGAPLAATPGKVYEANFVASNRSSRPVVAQAVPSVTPVAAAAHFNKVECFCFTRQRLEPGETRVMPVRFVVDEDLPARVAVLTLGYTFFEAEPPVERPDRAAQAAAVRTPAVHESIGANG